MKNGKEDAVWHPLSLSILPVVGAGAHDGPSIDIESFESPPTVLKKRMPFVILLQIQRLEGKLSNYV